MSETVRVSCNAIFLQFFILKNQIEYMENLNENQAPKELKNKYLNDFQCLKKYCDFRKIKIENLMKQSAKYDN